MAAYASLLSLGQILDQLLQHPPRQIAVLDKAQIDHLLENITVLQDYLEDFSRIRGDEIEPLEEKIATSAYAAEDIIVRRVVDQILEDSEAGSESIFTPCCQDLQKVIEEIGSVKEDVVEIKETEGIKIMEQTRKAATAGSFIPGESDSKNTMVEFHKDLNKITETLTGGESKLQILSLVGMSGIGRTTLARHVYHHPYMASHFDVQAWVTISEQCSVHGIVLAILKDIGVLAECSEEDGGEEITQPSDELGKDLYKSLYGRTYLIVMDDLWSIEFWDDIKRFFPYNNNGSRVMVTTRLSNVANDFRSYSPYQLQFLGNYQSWALFGDKVFGKESCFPPELEEVGKTIVRNCGGLLVKSIRTVEDQILEDSEAGSERSSTLFRQDLQKVIEEIASMKKYVMKITETEGIKSTQQPRKDATAGSFQQGASNIKNTMVGFHEDLKQIMETLTGDESNLQILSIVGMGGIGKTTLAKNVFDNQVIVRHFDLRAWVTISQQYSVHKILLGLLKEIGGEESTQEHDDELGLRLHKSLYERRYFIVMDDMWSIEVWDGIKRFFPDNKNGSRVMITTRLLNVADHLYSCTPHQLEFLGHVQSWVLFCDKVFGKESCPPELEKVGRTIVGNCRGLPLAIVSISGLLAKSSRMVEYWESVADDTYAALNREGDRLCFEILYLSYKHLPVHLKPCFLYLAIFPEDHKIRIPKLVKLWAAEGILKPTSHRSSKEIAEDNLKDLRDRNLIQVHDYGPTNKIKTCTIHDLFRDLCLREAQKEKFLCVTRMHSLNNQSRIFDNNRRLINKEELKSTFSKLCGLRKKQKKVYIFSDEEIVRLVNSRFIECDAGIFSSLLSTLESLSLLWNLQTVIITGVMPINLPVEIWEMPQLMHLKREKGVFNLPDPPSTNIKNGRGDVIVLKNLQTLSKMRNFWCTDEVVHRIPNLKKLGITYREFPDGFGWDYREVYDLSNLHNLESLIFDSFDIVLRNLCFPQSLKKLTLERWCRVSWEDLTVVGSLPNLEVLHLMDGAVQGREWNPVEGQFLELKSLRIKFTDLVEWIADRSHFPCLEELELCDLRYLHEIPEDFGEITTLRSISLLHCSDSANSSARKMREEQQNFEVRVNSL